MRYRQGKMDSSVWAGIVITAAIGLGFVSVIFFDTTGKNGSGLSSDYEYNISEYTNIDPALITYKQSGQTILTGLKISHCIAVKDDFIYVGGDESVLILSKQGKIEKAVVLEYSPRCLAIDNDGAIVVGMGNNVFVFDTFGTKQKQWEVPAKNAVLTSIAVDNEHVFVADAANGLIYCYEKAGKLVCTIGRKDPAKEDQVGFVIPGPYFDVAMASDGLLRVVDPGRHQIVAFTVAGDREWAWGEATPKIEGFSGCCNPVNFAMLPDGSFVTAEKGLVRVKVYDAEGKFVGVVAGAEQLEWNDPQQVCNTPEQCQSKGFDVAVDNDGKIYVLDTVNNVVRVFEKK